MKKPLAALLSVGLGAIVILQLVRPPIPEKPATAEIDAPPEVKKILEKSCYSCHSDQRRLAWFDEIEPAYWLVRKDILTARQHLDFSTLGSLPAATQKAALYEATTMMQLGAMPLHRYLLLHPEAKVAPEDLALMKKFLNPWKDRGPQATPPSERTNQKSDVAAIPAETSKPLTPLDRVSPEPNGIAFESGFEGWKLLSVTDRGDNGTFRLILGNDIAIQAVRSGHISPWPEGSRIAKIAWQQERNTAGLIRPGKFIQVEFMTKDAKHYKDTDGWGWSRWRGLDLKPYGKDSTFPQECRGCHLPVRKNDSVYTMPITTAKINEDLANQKAAALPASLPYQPLAWQPITLFVDPASNQMATLFANDTALSGIQRRGAFPPDAHYPPGSVLALVTWTQAEDPHWFGARIPETPIKIEFVEIPSTAEQSSYQQFAGAGLPRKAIDSQTSTSRRAFITGLLPASLP